MSQPNPILEISLPNSRNSGVSTALAILALVTLTTLGGWGAAIAISAETSQSQGISLIPEVTRRLSRATTTYLDHTDSVEKVDSSRFWAVFRVFRAEALLAAGQVTMPIFARAVDLPGLSSLPPPCAA